MGISLSGYKVIYGEKVLNALALLDPWTEIPEKDEKSKGTIIKPNRLAILAIDTDGTLIVIEDEAWQFQFIPRIN